MRFQPTFHGEVRLWPTQNWASRVAIVWASHVASPRIMVEFEHVSSGQMTKPLKLKSSILLLAGFTWNQTLILLISAKDQGDYYSQIEMNPTWMAHECPTFDCLRLFSCLWLWPVHKLYSGCIVHGQSITNRRSQLGRCSTFGTLKTKNDSLPCKHPIYE